MDDDENIFSNKPLENGTIAPDFTITPLDSQESFLLSSLQGKYVVLEFWASWCPDCQAATADMVKLYEDYHSDSIIFIGFSLDIDEQQLKTYIKENSMDWIQASEFIEWQQNPIALAYNVSWIPTLYLIDKEGKIEFSCSNADEMAQKLAAI